MTRPGTDKILAFWSWFASTADELASQFDNEVLLEQLDGKVSEMGELAWEIGPGLVYDNALAVSPDGNRGLLPVTKKIVAAAPVIPRWEFHPARPPRREAFEFSIGSSHEAETAIDAHGWRYVLFRYPDSRFELILEQSNLSRLAEEDRYTAAIVFVDALLGEEQRLEYIDSIDLCLGLSSANSKRASPVTVLAAHLNQLLRKTAP